MEFPQAIDMPGGRNDGKYCANSFGFYNPTSGVGRQDTAICAQNARFPCSSEEQEFNSNWQQQVGPAPQALNPNRKTSSLQKLTTEGLFDDMGTYSHGLDHQGNLGKRFSTLSHFPTQSSGLELNRDVPTLRRSNTASTAQTSTTVGLFSEEAQSLTRHNSQVMLPGEGFLPSQNPGFLSRSHSEMIHSQAFRNDAFREPGSAPGLYTFPHAHVGADRLQHMQPQSKPKKKTTGPVHNAKYKAKLCKNWVQRGMCPYYEKCQFAHGEHEIEKWAMRRNKLRQTMNATNNVHNIPGLQNLQGNPGANGDLVRAEVINMLKQMQQRNGGHLNPQDVSKLVTVLGGAEDNQQFAQTIAGMERRATQSLPTEKLSGISESEGFPHLDSARTAFSQDPRTMQPVSGLNLNLPPMDECSSLSYTFPSSKSSLNTFGLLESDSAEDIKKNEEKSVNSRESGNLDTWKDETFNFDARKAKAIPAVQQNLDVGIASKLENFHL